MMRFTEVVRGIKVGESPGHRPGDGLGQGEISGSGAGVAFTENAGDFFGLNQNIVGPFNPGSKRKFGKKSPQPQSQHQRQTRRRKGELIRIKN